MYLWEKWDVVSLRLELGILVSDHTISPKHKIRYMLVGFSRPCQCGKDFIYRWIHV